MGIYEVATQLYQGIPIFRWKRYQNKNWSLLG
jgi:hypothetical protein